MTPLTPAEHAVGLRLLGGVPRWAAEAALSSDPDCQRLARDVTAALAPVVDAVLVFCRRFDEASRAARDGVACCTCCVAAAQRGELDHPVGDACPYPPCAWHG